MSRPARMFLCSLLFALATGLSPRSAQAQPHQAPSAQSGSDLLGAVNSLRASRGLPAYNANSILMGIAQAQADYLAATGGSAGHVGPDGTYPKDRALAAGYPATLFSENWQCGNGLSPASAVSAWQGDFDHLNTMLSGGLVDAGAGVGKSGGLVCYILDAGASGPPSGGNGTPLSGTAPPAATTGPSQFMAPVITNTPNADGFVYHEVGYGQSLWSIAIAYGTKIDAIKALNNLADVAIQPGQKLLVLKGPTPVPPTPTKTSAPARAEALASPTISSTRTAPSTPTAALARLAATQPAPPAMPAGPRHFNVTAFVIVGAALLFAALGTWMGTRKPA